jgi:hypothetical protein
MPALAYPAYIHLPSIISSDLKARRNALASYKDLKKQFQERGVGYHRQLFLRNLAARLKLETGFEDLYKWLNSIANDLLMEELEVALWGWYLDQLKVDELDIEDTEALWMLAYAAKQYFNADTRVLESVCGAHIKGFPKTYESWKIQIGLVADISLSELNSMLSALAKPRTSPSRSQGRDYNIAVEELLAAPSHRSRAEEYCDQAPDPSQE